MSIGPDFDGQVSRYLASLTHLRSANGHYLPVCSICRGPTGVKDAVGEHWPTCQPCRQHRYTSGIDYGELADSTGSIIYALKYADGSSDQSLRDMRQYKIFSPSWGSRPAISEEGQRIRTLLYVTLRDHLPRLEESAGPVDLITQVPSTSTEPGRDPQALAAAIESAVKELPGLAPYQSVLGVGQSDSGTSRSLDPGRFPVTDPDSVAGRHVLLVEDTWVTGASVQSAAVSLHRAGAARVTVLCVARMLREEWKAGNYLTSRYAEFPPPAPHFPVF